MQSNPTLRVIQKVIRQVEPAALRRAGDWAESSGQVSVNGIHVPVLRLGWSNVGPFFEELYRQANQELFENGSLPRCRLVWNKRFRNLGGRIDPQNRVLELSAAHYEACGAVALGVVLVHEQIHLALYEQGLPHGHTRAFKSLSGNLGLPSIHHEMPLPERLRPAPKLHWYRCRCGKVISSRIRFHKPRACAECCHRHAKGRYDSRFNLRYIGTFARRPGGAQATG